MFINQGMDKEDMVHIHSGILVIKRNEIVQFAATCKDLETVIQSKISQKEKGKYCTLTHMCGIYKNGIDDLICKAELETQTQRTNIYQGGKGRWDELGDWG